MFTINNDKTMTVVQGDTAIFTISPRGYYFVEGDEAIFTVKKSAKERKNMIQKSVKVFEDDGMVAKFFLGGDDTRLPVGEYLYDIQLNLADGRIDTVVLPTKFIVLEGINHG